MSNVIVENILTRTDAYGYATMIMQAMLNHRKYETAGELKNKHACVNNHKKLRKSAQGWDLEVTWQDRTTSLLPLENLKI